MTKNAKDKYLAQYVADPEATQEVYYCGEVMLQVPVMYIYDAFTVLAVHNDIPPRNNKGNEELNPQEILLHDAAYWHARNLLLEEQGANYSHGNDPLRGE
jgi:hypothetical protein